MIFSKEKFGILESSFTKLIKAVSKRVPLDNTIRIPGMSRHTYNPTNIENFSENESEN